MKKVSNLSKLFMFLTLLVSFLIVGCQKDNELSTPEENVTNSLDGMYIMNSSGNQISPESVGIEISDLQNETVQSATQRNGNTHANAHYSLQPDPEAFYKNTTVTFSATENNQGVSGTGHITRTWGDNEENSFQLILDADCILTQGDEAIFVGILTQVTGDAPVDEETGDIIFPIGSKWWIKGKDNGQGANAPADECEQIFFWNPSGTLPCEFLGFNFPIWFFFPDEPVLNQSDNINVN